jgi:hypothetical protein
VSHFREIGGSVWGGVAVYDGNNGIMAFGTNLLGLRSVPLWNFYRFVYMEPINRFFDHLLVVVCLRCGQIIRARVMILPRLPALLQHHMT